MSTVCYCGQPDCPVTTWEHDACVANLRAERDALKTQVEAWEEKAKVWLMSPEAATCLDGYRELGEKCARLEAQVEAAQVLLKAARRWRELNEPHRGMSAAIEGDDILRKAIDAMDEAARRVCLSTPSLGDDGVLPQGLKDDGEGR